MYLLFVPKKKKKNGKSRSKKYLQYLSNPRLDIFGLHSPDSPIPDHPAALHCFLVYLTVFRTILSPPSDRSLLATGNDTRHANLPKTRFARSSVLALAANPSFFPAPFRAPSLISIALHTIAILPWHNLNFVPLFCRSSCSLPSVPFHSARRSSFSFVLRVCVPVFFFATPFHRPPLYRNPRTSLSAAAICIKLESEFSC